MRYLLVLILYSLAEGGDVTGSLRHAFTNITTLLDSDLIPMARYIMHNSVLASFATISAHPTIEGYPFANFKSVVDGTISISTGVPYFYMSTTDVSARDLMRKNKATVVVVLDDPGVCARQQWDAEKPRCTKLMLCGKIVKIIQGTLEHRFAKNALFERHPIMQNYPAEYNWYPSKLKIKQVALLDRYGGAKYIPVKDYLAYNYTNDFALYEQTTPQPWSYYSLNVVI